MARVGFLDRGAGTVSRLRGCLETAAVLAFALLAGAFLMSTWVRHSDGESRDRSPPSAAAPAGRSERARIRVEVKNGSGIPGAAERTTDFLRERGFDVVDFGNAERFGHERTLVIDRSRAPSRAREVAAALQGVPIRTDPDSTLFLDVTVVVGADLDAVLSGRSRSADGGESRWRRWLERVPWPGD